MTVRSFLLDDALADYVADHSPKPDPVFRGLIDRTKGLGSAAGMQIGVDQAALLTMLVQLVGAEHAIEVGTFTGASSLAIARGLAPGGHLLCCDTDLTWTRMAREAWAQAKLQDRITLELAPAIETLRNLHRQEFLDFAFIDADKAGYPDYYEEIVPRLRSGGLLVADNTLWGGRIVDDDGEAAVALRAYNDRAASDPRVDTVLLTVADGLTISRKR